jgi:uncharacterized protein
MTRLDRDRSATGPLVQAFSGNGFRIDGIVYAAGVKLTPLTAHPWMAPLPGGFTARDLDDLVALDRAPEFILLGTGATLRRPDHAVIADLQGCGIGVEIMDSRAAARAWGLLRGEGRWIAAALMPLDQR